MGLKWGVTKRKYNAQLNALGSNTLVIRVYTSFEKLAMRLYWRCHHNTAPVGQIRLICYFFFNSGEESRRDFKRFKFTLGMLLQCHI